MLFFCVLKHKGLWSPQVQIIKLGVEYREVWLLKNIKAAKPQETPTRAEKPRYQQGRAVISSCVWGVIDLQSATQCRSHGCHFEREPLFRCRSLKWCPVLGENSGLLGGRFPADPVWQRCEEVLLFALSLRKKQHDQRAWGWAGWLNNSSPPPPPPHSDCDSCLFKSFS